MHKKEKKMEIFRELRGVQCRCVGCEEAVDRHENMERSRLFFQGRSYVSLLGSVLHFRNKLAAVN